MDADRVIRPVFLSASEPNPKRSKEYWDSRRLLNVREAVRAFCAHVLPHYPVVFGGHPAIAPLVRQVAERVAHQAEVHVPRDEEAPKRPRVVMFQSRLFVDREDSTEEVMTDAHEADGRLAEATGGMRNASLLRMRYEMLGFPNAEPVHPLLNHYRGKFGDKRKERLNTYQFEAAVFIGGMEGVEREFFIFRDFHPSTPAYPIASTGRACEQLLSQVESHLNANIVPDLADEPAYSLLMQEILPVPSRSEQAATPRHWRPEPPDKPNDSARHIDPPAIDAPRPRRR
jgi:hypothetical protein